jgi:hypothetical protein
MAKRGRAGSRLRSIDSVAAVSHHRGLGQDGWIEVGRGGPTTPSSAPWTSVDDSRAGPPNASPDEALRDLDAIAAYREAWLGASRSQGRT